MVDDGKFRFLAKKREQIQKKRRHIIRNGAERKPLLTKNTGFYIVFSMRNTPSDCGNVTNILPSNINFTTLLHIRFIY